MTLNWFKRFFEKPKPVSASRLFSPDEAPESIEKLETEFSRLQRFQPLVRHLAVIEELIEYEMGLATTVLTDPSQSQERAQFFRGAFWLAKQIGQKLVGLEIEIANKDRALTEAKKKPENVVR